jgi:hypothetical protein
VEISAQLQATVQVRGAKIRHSDIPGNKTTEPGTASSLYRNEFGTRCIRILDGMTVLGNEKACEDGHHKVNGLLHGSIILTDNKYKKNGEIKKGPVPERTGPISRCSFKT